MLKNSFLTTLGLLFAACTLLILGVGVGLSLVDANNPFRELTAILIGFGISLLLALIGGLVYGGILRPRQLRNHANPTPAPVPVRATSPTAKASNVIYPDLRRFDDLRSTAFSDNLRQPRRER
ncbi:MAG: hypothetical protein IAE80_19445 [Anaerolinea sp.]|nr:hypothetical protein [Anaerolinea sp.]